MRAPYALVLIACGGAQHVEEPRCPIERRLVLASPEEVRGAAGCRTASAVIVRTGATLDFAQLGRLESIEGDLVIGPTVGVDEVQFVALRSVGGTIHVSSNGAVRGVYLPKLERAGRIEIEGNVALTTVSLPRLAAVAGGVSVTDNAVLELFDAGALVTIGKELVVDGAPSLTLLELGKLVKDAGIRIERAPLLPPEVVEQLGKPPASP